MTEHELLLRTNDAAVIARNDGFENFAKSLEEIAESLLKQIEASELAMASKVVNPSKLEFMNES